jgi:hypothetical protein
MALSGWRSLGRCGRVLGRTTSPNPYRGFRFPADVIQHAVWLTWGSLLSTTHPGSPSHSDPWLEPVFFRCGTRTA